MKKIEIPKNPLPPPGEHFEALFAAARYEEKGLMAELIHEYKYHFSFRMADFLFPIMLRELSKFEDILKNGILMPIPLHPKRKHWRGFNQAELLAKKIAEYFGLVIETRKLIRIKNTEPQAKLSREERLKNMEGAFFFSKGPNVPEKIFLVDDVISTGETMNQAAKAIKKEWPKVKIYSFVLAIPL